jgi:hypothetical protein
MRTLIALPLPFRDPERSQALADADPPRPFAADHDGPYIEVTGSARDGLRLDHGSGATMSTSPTCRCARSVMPTGR